MTQIFQSPAATGHTPTDDELPAQPVTAPVLTRQLHTALNTCQVVAVGGGKGGIGKSLVSANMAVSLAQSGKQVVLLDADLGGANLHTYLGMPPPKRTLSEFVSRQAEHLDELITPTNVQNLGLISGALDALGAANLKYSEKVRLLREILRLKVDVVVVDLGGGTAAHVIDLFLLARYGILTVVPEPTSIENAYRFIKSACLRRLRSVAAAWMLPAPVQQLLNVPETKGAPTPAELLRQVERLDPAAAAKMRHELERFPYYLVVNQVRTSEEGRLGPAMVDACRRYFGVRMQYLGAIQFDDAVWMAVRHRRPVVLESPHARASEQLRQLGITLGLEKPS